MLAAHERRQALQKAPAASGIEYQVQAQPRQLRRYIGSQIDPARQAGDDPRSLEDLCHRRNALAHSHGCHSLSKWLRHGMGDALRFARPLCDPGRPGTEDLRVVTCAPGIPSSGLAEAVQGHPRRAKFHLLHAGSLPTIC